MHVLITEHGYTVYHDTIRLNYYPLIHMCTVQANLFVTRSVFSEIITEGTHWLPREGVKWGILCALVAWTTSYTVIAILCVISHKNNALPWCHNKVHGVSNHQHPDCLLSRLLRRRSKKTPKRRLTGLFEGKPRVTGGFPSQRASNAEMFPFDDVIMVRCMMNCVIRMFLCIYHS